MKTCIECDKFVFKPGEYDYSEWTPGYDTEIYCIEGHWQIAMYEDTTRTYKEKLETAEKCKDFTPITLD